MVEAETGALAIYEPQGDRDADVTVSRPLARGGRFRRLRLAHAAYTTAPPAAARRLIRQLSDPEPEPEHNPKPLGRSFSAARRAQLDKMLADPRLRPPARDGLLALQQVLGRAAAGAGRRGALDAFLRVDSNQPLAEVPQPPPATPSQH